MRPWHARRGGGGVDEAGGRLRRPGQAVRKGQYISKKTMCASNEADSELSS